MNPNALAVLVVLLAVHDGLARTREAGADRGAGNPAAKTDAGRAGEKAELERQRAQRLEAIERAAAKYEIYLGPNHDTKLTLLDEPLLRWNNPIRYSLDGATFLWTAEGRPQVAACLYSSVNRDDFVTLDHEFQSLAVGPVSARRGGRPVWYPTEPGIGMKLLPEAGTPAKMATMRLVQMRRLAGQFTAIGYNMEKTDHWRLRLMPRPLYRYGGEDDELTDGALFVFAHGTDPDVIVLLEARGDRGEPQWYYGLARMCGLPVEVRHRDRLIWDVPLRGAPWQPADPTETYITLYNIPVGE